MLFASAATAFLLCVLLTPLVIRASSARGLFDHPGERRVHSTPVPRLGGVAVACASVAGVGVGLLLYALPEAPSYAFFATTLGGGLLLFAVGLVDDVRGVSPRVKLLAQVAAGALAFGFGFRVEALTVGGHANVAVGWLSFPLTLFWIVAVTNAYNLVDGLDGLASGLGLVALTTVLAVAHVLGHADVALVAAALAGALLGFLRYNFNPARIFLGDSGSLFVGFLLAVLSVRASTKSSTAVLVLVPLLALGVPLLDTSVAIVRRWLRGLSMSSADRRHIHHRLLSLGFSTRGAVLVLYAVASAAALLSVMALFASPQQVGWITLAGGVASLLLLVCALRHLGYHEFEVAARMVLRAPLRLRKALRDRIHAHDLVPVLRVASSLEEINAVLSDNAAILQLGHMEVCPVDEGTAPRDVCAGLGQRVWRVDYPLTSFDPEHDTWMVLRMWCPLDARAPNGTERVASILGPVIAAWLQDEIRTRTEFHQAAQERHRLLARIPAAV
jgi:UDP-GlcNAc:undecaprenyl-phosphate GlcNAc-1-phosphate transferase